MIHAAQSGFVATYALGHMMATVHQHDGNRTSTWWQPYINMMATVGEHDGNRTSTWRQPYINMMATVHQHDGNCTSTWWQPYINMMATVHHVSKCMSCHHCHGSAVHKYSIPWVIFISMVDIKNPQRSLNMVPLRPIINKNIAFLLIEHLCN